MQQQFRPDKVIARMNLRIAKALPVPVRRIFVRTSKRVPKIAYILVVAAIGCAAGTIATRAQHEVVAFARIALMSWSNGNVLTATLLATVAVALLALLAAMVLHSNSAWSTLCYLAKPTLATRRTIQRYQGWATTCSMLGVMLLPCAGLAATLSARNDMLRLNAELAVRGLAYTVAPTTAARILREEKAGEWYATPDDGPKALALKRELLLGSLRGRDDVRMLLEIDASGRLPALRQPLE